jgi:hypothetical protein
MLSPVSMDSSTEVLPADDLAVHRDLLAGPDQEKVALLDFLDRQSRSPHRGLPAFWITGRRLRLEAHELS